LTVDYRLTAAIEGAPWKILPSTSVVAPRYCAGCSPRARADRSRWLPCLPVTQLSTVEGSIWKPFRPRHVDIPASVILEGKVWTFIREGMRGLLVKDEAGVERVYIICEPSTSSFRVMTRSDWMSVLIGERF
jgi:hypothetical protein